MLNNVPLDVIIPEDKSGSTAENARFSELVLSERGIHPKTAILCCKNFHARRCLMFYQFAFPKTRFIINPVPYYENGQDITRGNWYKFEIGLNRVLGELHRLGNQFFPDFLSLMECKK